MSPEETLRAAIAASLAARGCDSHTIDEHSNSELALFLPHIAVLTAHAYARADALRALALACGLRDDGSDPLAELARVTAERDAAYAALRECAPRCGLCNAPAVCFGAYEGCSPGVLACDDRCGHGNEDGHCSPVNHSDALRAAREDVALLRTRSRESAATIDTLTRERDAVRADGVALRAAAREYFTAREAYNASDAVHEAATWARKAAAHKALMAMIAQGDHG